MMIFLIESIVACVLFTVMIKLVTMCKGEAFENDYPKVVTDKLRQKGILKEKPPAKRVDCLRKLIAMFILAMLFALLLRKMNGITSFWLGTLTAYGLWLVVDWYDFFVIDILLAPFDKFYKVSGVSAFNKQAVWFHFRGSLRGMILGVIFALLAGFFVKLL